LASRKLQALKLHITLGAIFVVTTFFCIIASMQIHAAAHAR
jgi:hypothetical protein